jgi:cytochrome c oxidase subunit 2
MNRCLLLVAAAVVAAGCLPRPATTEARSIADLYWIFMAAAAVVAGVVYVLATWAVLRYRRRGDRLPKQVFGNAGLELAWTAVPALTVLVLFILTLGALGRVERSSDPAGGSTASAGAGDAATGAEAGGAVRLEVTAFRWGWRFTYPDEGITVSGLVDQPAEAVLPVGRPIHLELSATDVAHAFYVPQFLFKRDAIPGHQTSFSITIEEPGTYAGQCAEFCGIYHARMPFTIRAVPELDYEAWLEQAALLEAEP